MRVRALALLRRDCAAALGIKEAIVSRERSRIESPYEMMSDPGTMPLRAQVARMRSIHRAEHAEMAERTRIARATFVQQIRAEVTERIMPEVAQLRATFRAEHADMSERTRIARQVFVNQISAWVG